MVGYGRRFNEDSCAEAAMTLRCVPHVAPLFHILGIFGLITGREKHSIRLFAMFALSQASVCRPPQTNVNATTSPLSVGYTSTNFNLYTTTLCGFVLLSITPAS